ncbi:Hsp70 family protein [Pontiellaceae bacterium B12227]|nr:Hsp70 family protein [Pontiellaceae bacterium B12227]
MAMGMDVGTTRGKSVIYDDTGAAKPVKFNGENSFLTCVYIDDDGTVFIGEEAFRMMCLNPRRGVLHWKRKLGTNEPILIVDGREYTARDILRMFIEHIKETFEKQTGRLLKEVVMTAPANVSDLVKREIRSVAEECGLEVLQVAHEPTAALFANYENNRAPGLYVIVDVGGGTTDVSIGEVSGDNITIKGTRGIEQLGGLDFTNRLLEYVLGEFKEKYAIEITTDTHPQEHEELYQRVEKAKCALSTQESASIVIVAEGNALSVKVTRDKFNEICKDLILQIVDCVDYALKETSTSPNQLNEIIPVGGGSLVPGVGDALQERFGQSPTSRTDVHHAVAHGAAIACRLAIEKRGGSVVLGNTVLPPLRLMTRDVTAHAFGVTVLKESDQELYNSVILRKGLAFPCNEFTEPFKLAERDQTDVYIEILQGDHGARRDDCHLLGKFELNGLSRLSDPNHEHLIMITFKLDGDGVLTARARDSIDGIEADLQIEAI